MALCRIFSPHREQTDAAAAAVAVVVAVVVAGIPHSHEGTIEPRNSRIGQSRAPNQIA